ncbi:MAG: sulfatase-like hydrolase/transferase, partial [Prolixibacteraceae bacterium]
MKRSQIILAAGILSSGFYIPLHSEGKPGQNKKPNIIFILADDLGYGDIRVNNQDSKIPTPNIDRLASQGIRFTDAHSPSSVCTPTRYSILTGRYSWRSRLPVGVLHGYSPSLIEKERTTVASFLKKNGYTTAIVG